MPGVKVAMPHANYPIESISLNMAGEGRQRLVLYAVVVAIIIHGVAIWLLLGRSVSQPLLPPKQRIEVNLVAPAHPPSAAAPMVSPPVPPKVRPIVAPHSKSQSVPIKHIEVPVARPVEHVAKPDPIPEKPAPEQLSTPSVAVPVKSAEPPQPIPVSAPPPIHETKPEPISPPGFDAAYLNNPKPVYPATARRMGLEGLVVLRVKVDVHGKPQDVQVLTSSGSPVLDRSAVEIVSQQWTFVPARQGDHPVVGIVDVPIRFSLR